MYTVKLKCAADATIDKAYDVFTMPDFLSQWFTKEAHADLRVGGAYANPDKD